jgi:tellurite resistance protein
MLVAANGRVDQQELQTLEELDAFARLGVSRHRFVAFANACVRDVGGDLRDRSWLSVEHLAYIDGLLDLVSDPDTRLLVCRLASAVVTADGKVTPDERLVYDHALAHWQISHAQVTQAILSDRPA